MATMRPKLHILSLGRVRSASSRVSTGGESTKIAPSNLVTMPILLEFLALLPVFVLAFPTSTGSWSDDPGEIVDGAF